jgi:hypothetical protein
VALLMDGQQLGNRWPARYASVLADDPGSSVLSLTSLGMIRLHKRTNPNAPVSIGLWSDALENRGKEIVLEVGSKAVLLPIKQVRKREYSTDGREADATYCVLQSEPIQIKL